MTTPPMVLALDPARPYIDTLTGNLVRVLSTIPGGMTLVEVERAYPTSAREKRFVGDEYMTPTLTLRVPTDADMKALDRKAPNRRKKPAADGPKPA